MNRDVVQEAIKESLYRGTATPSLESDRDAYIQREANRLFESLVEPVPVNVTGRSFDYESLGLSVYDGAYAIARSESRWLLYMESSGHFALAFGNSPSNLSALGFDSTDALAEWLG